MSRINSLIFFFVCIAFCASCSTRDNPSKVEQLMEKGGKLYDAGMFQKALAPLEQALQLEPDSPRTLFQMARVCQKLGEFDRSTTLVRKTINSGHHVVEGHLMMAQNYIMSGRFEEAEKACKSLEGVAPENYRLKLIQGHIHSFMEQYGKGAALYRKAIDIDEERPEAYFHLAANLTAQKKEKQADKYYAKALKLNEKPTTAFWFNKGQYLTLKGNIDEARRAFGNALKQEPSSVYIQLKIAQLFLFAKQYQELYRFFGEKKGIAKQHEAIQKLAADALLNTGRLNDVLVILQRHHRSEQYDWLLLTGKYHLLQGNHTAAISYLESAVEKRKDDPRPHHLLALAYLAGDKINLASRTWIRLLTVAPEITDVELGIADLYYKKKHYDLSLEYLRRIIRHNPENYRAYIILGNCMLANGCFKEAEINYQKALALNPDSIPAMYYLAVTKESGGRKEEAVRIYKSVLERKPGLADAGLRLARLFMKTKRTDDAIAFFNALAKKQPENGYLNFILGEIYHSSQQVEKAKANYTQALKKNPNLVQAYQKLVEMEPAYEKKVALIKGAIEKSPDAAELVITLAGLYYRADDLDSAISVMEGLHAADPKSPSVSNNLSWLYLEKDINYTQAYELSRFAYKSDPENPNYAHTMGWACFKKGFLKEAEWHLRKSLDLFDTQKKKGFGRRIRKSIFDYHLARLLIQTGKREEAMARLSAALDEGLPDKYEKSARKLMADYN